MPGKPFAPSLAESYEFAPDNKSATFKLRQGIKFHDGKPITPEDVKFTFEKYRGANAGILKEKTAAIETPDDRTIKFVFKEPFLDFLTIYGSPSSGAGWIVPKAYYEQVGPNGFKQKPIGAGPYRFVKQQAGNEIEFEAFEEYWRKSPSVKTMIMRGIPEASTRLAGLQTGELDVANQMPGDLLETIRKDPKLRLVPLKAGPVWLEPMSFDAPGQPDEGHPGPAGAQPGDRPQGVQRRRDGRPRVARRELDPGTTGPGALQRDDARRSTSPRRSSSWPTPASPNGFEVSQITPLPPYTSFAERIVGLPARRSASTPRSTRWSGPPSTTPWRRARTG